MHRIAVLQNEQRQLDRLAAQRQLYSSAKNLLGRQLLLGGPVATVVSLVGIAMPGTRGAVALWGVLVLVLDWVWLTPRQKRLREAAARIQEQFDCDVLGLKWNSYKAGDPEPPELVFEQAARYQARGHQMPSLVDWYPRIVDRLPLPLARLVCQRTNCWWDAKQRRHYADVIAAVLLILFFTVFGIGLAAALSVEQLLAVSMPLFTTVKLAYQQLTENREAADRLDKLRARVERTWKEALEHPLSGSMEEYSQALQAEIYDGRKRNPLVFDFVFRRLRAGNETQMNAGAAELVTQAQKALADVNTSGAA